MKLDRLQHTSGMDENAPEILSGSLRALLDASPDMIFVKDMNLTYVAGTQSFANMMGKASMEEVLGRTDYELFEDKELSLRYTADDRKLLDEGKDLIDYVEPITEENGQARYSLTSKYILTDGNGDPIGLLGISRDITKEMRAKQQYQQEIKFLFSLPPDAYSTIFIDVTAWRIIGQRRQKIFDYIPPLYDTLDHFLASARWGLSGEGSEEARRFYGAFSSESLQALYDSGESSLFFEYPRALTDTNSRWVRDDLKFMSDPDTDHLCLMLVVRDINDKKQAENELAQAAITDEMTHLLTHSATKRQIQEFLSDAGKEGSHAIFMIDVDNFKSVNDRFGHQQGDDLLIKLADKIKSCFRSGDIVGRVGGDEFLVLAKNMSTQSAAKERAEHLLETVRSTDFGQSVSLFSVSVGISMYPQDGKTLSELYAQADKALYRAKILGKNQMSFSSDPLPVHEKSFQAYQYEDYNSLVVDHAGSICYISDLATYDLLHLTKAGMDICGLTKPEEYRGKKCYEILQGLDKPCPFCTNDRLREGQEYRWEHCNEKFDRWFDITDTLLWVNGRQCRMEIARDITARKKAASGDVESLTMEDVLFRCLNTLTVEDDLNQAIEQFLSNVGGYYQASRAYIIEFDLDHQTMSNTFEWCQTSVSAEIRNLQALPLHKFSDLIWRLETEGAFFIHSIYDDLDSASEEFRILESKGAVSLMAAPLMHGSQIVGYIAVNDPRRNEGNLTLLQSVSSFVLAELERRRLMDELTHMSYTDALTGLKNRNQYDRTLREYDRRTPNSLGIFYVDINGLKGINNTHGHSYGDHMIKKTGSSIKNNTSGQVFRTGGDEFVVLCENISKEDFRRELIALHSVFDRDEEISVSIGYAWREAEENIQELLLQASELLSAEKQSYYHAVLRDGRSTTYTGFASEVVRELEGGQFIVFYQPQVDIKTGEIVGAEALVRKKDENGGLIPPNKFIPFYEAEGVISHVDLFVLRSACTVMQQWLASGHTVYMSVNFSRITLLEPDIVETIKEICRQYDVPTDLITIEVTESISKMDNDQLKELIETINDAGFSISLDDFGSKYSNLAILASMDFDEIKFDRSLVEALESNHKSRVVMESSVKMCRNLDGTSSLAEGIETKGQLDLLLDYQCDYGQGYYFSKPVPPEEFQRLLNRSKEPGKD